MGDWVHLHNNGAFVRFHNFPGVKHASVKLLTTIQTVQNQCLFKNKQVKQLSYSHTQDKLAVRAPQQASITWLKRCTGIAGSIPARALMLHFLQPFLVRLFIVKYILTWIIDLN